MLTHSYVPRYIAKMWFAAGTLNCIANICNREITH